MVEPLGPNPRGLFIYTPTGQLSIQAMRTPPSGPLAGEPVRLGSLAALRPFYFGYFGTYSILTDSTVVHHVVGGTFPDYIGTDQLRQYTELGVRCPSAHRYSSVVCRSEPRNHVPA